MVRLGFGTKAVWCQSRCSQLLNEWCPPPSGCDTASGGHGPQAPLLFPDTICRMSHAVPNPHPLQPPHTYSPLLDESSDFTDLGRSQQTILLPAVLGGRTCHPLMTKGETEVLWGKKKGLPCSPGQDSFLCLSAARSHRQQSILKSWVGFPDRAPLISQ